LTKQSSKDDWLGLGDDHTDQMNDLLSSGELFSPRNRPPPAPKKTMQPKIQKSEEGTLTLSAKLQ